MCLIVSFLKKSTVKLGSSTMLKDKMDLFFMRVSCFWLDIERRHMLQNNTLKVK